MEELLGEKEKPSWFSYPQEFSRVMDLGLVNLEPWIFIFGDELKERLQGLQSRYPDRHLVPFAKRIDNDDIVCWEKGEANAVFLIHDYASSGHEQRHRYDTFLMWYKSAIDDMIYFE